MQRQRINNPTEWEEWVKTQQDDRPCEATYMDFSDAPINYPVVVVWQINYPNDNFCLDYCLVSSFAEK